MSNYFYIPDTYNNMANIFKRAVMFTSGPESVIEDIMKLAETYTESSSFLVNESEKLNNQYQLMVVKLIEERNYKLTSVNWLTNFNITDTFNKEFYKNFNETEVWSWYFVLCSVVIYWLEKRHGCWVYSNHLFNTIDMYSLWKQFGMIEVKNDTDKNEVVHSLDDIQELCLNNQLDFLFSETLQSLEKAYQIELDRVSFIHSKNRNEQDIKIPMSVVIDPFFLVLTFIH